MTVSLTTPIVQTNIQRWQIPAMDINTGIGTFRFMSSPANGQSVDMPIVLSDVANKSTGVRINATPKRWNDKIISVGPTGSLANGVGAANSLSNAQAAYSAGYAASGGGPIAKHNAGLKALELQGITDGWVDALLTGT